MENTNAAPKAQQAGEPMAAGKAFWHFISGKHGESGAGRSGLSHRQMGNYLRRRSRRATRPSEETIWSTVLSTIFDNTRIEHGKRIVKPGKISSGLR